MSRRDLLAVLLTLRPTKRHCFGAFWSLSRQAQAPLPLHAARPPCRLCRKELGGGKRARRARARGAGGRARSRGGIARGAARGRAAPGAGAPQVSGAGGAEAAVKAFTGRAAPTGGGRERTVSRAGPGRRRRAAGPGGEGAAASGGARCRGPRRGGASGSWVRLGGGRGGAAAPGRRYGERRSEPSAKVREREFRRRAELREAAVQRAAWGAAGGCRLRAAMWNFLGESGVTERCSTAVLELWAGCPRVCKQSCLWRPGASGVLFWGEGSGLFCST